MTRSPDRLFELLPVVYRARDAEAGYPLRALLRVLSEQVTIVEADIAHLYDNWFIETCDDWVVPYIADLIGYQPVNDPTQHAQSSGTPARAGLRFLVPRREVAETLALRQGKGTIATLERIASDVSGWPVRVVEQYKHLAWTQSLNHLRTWRGRSVDLRDGLALDALGGPFDTVTHGFDARRIRSRYTAGRYNIPNIAVFAWRLGVYPVTHAPACCLEAAGPHAFTFSVLGNDTPLYARPDPAASILPIQIRRRLFEERVSERPLKTRASARYYGDSGSPRAGGPGSVTIWAPDWPTKGAPQPVPAALIVPADLTDWRYRSVRGTVAVDPVLGRLSFPAGQLPRRGVWVTYHYAFSANMGGGEYTRTLTAPERYALYRVAKDAPAPGTFSTITLALKQWADDKQALGDAPEDPDARATWDAASTRLRSAVLEIQDSAAYSEPLAITLGVGESLQIRAANRKRPAIRLLDYMTERADAFSISGQQGSRFTLDGLLITGRSLRVSGPDRGDPYIVSQGDLCEIVIRHCTLVPGWGLGNDCEPKRPNEPSLELLNTTAGVTIDHSIIGSIYVTADEVQTDPIDLRVTDSIVDATSETRIAIGGMTQPIAFVRLSMVRSTVIGEVGVHAIGTVENAIFMSRLLIGRRQQGCLRFCYVTPGSRTPPRYHCQPDIAAARAPEAGDPLITADGETARVRPRFVSVRYGAPTYMRLADACAAEIRQGADDESEMGAFHDEYLPQREAALRARVEEFTAAGAQSGVIFVNE
jgi:hypothetical protein